MGALLGTPVAKESPRRELVEETWHTLRLAFRTLMGRIRADDARRGISLGRKVLLRTLVMGGRATSRELADAMGVTTGNIPGLLDKLEAEGLVTRTRSTKDRRAVYVDVTAKGRAEFQEMVRVMVDELVRAFGDWSDRDLKAVGHSLARLLPRDRCPPGTIARRSRPRRHGRGSRTSRLTRSPTKPKKRSPAHGRT